MSSVWTAGSSDDYKLGRKGVSIAPQKISLPSDCYVTGIALGWKHGYLITLDKHFYSWGSGWSWCLATGDVENRPTPALVNTFPPNFSFAQVVSGDKFGATIDENGTLMVWGCGYAHTPIKRELPAPVTAIAAGSVKLIAALADGRVATIHRKKEPIIHSIPNEKIISVAAGANHFVACSESGKAYTWGNAPGTGHNIPSDKPILVTEVFGNVINVFAFYNNTWFVTQDNRTFCCGSNSAGSLGLENSDSQSEIIENQFTFPSPIAQIACGEDSTMVLTVSGRLFVCGNGCDGRNMSGSDNRNPQFVESPYFIGKNVTQIAVGSFHSAVILDGAPPPCCPLGGVHHFSEFAPVRSKTALVFEGNTREIVYPGDSQLIQLALLPGDILLPDFSYFQQIANNCSQIFETLKNSKVIVIGISFEGFPVVCCEYGLKIISLPIRSPIESLLYAPLVERKNTHLIRSTVSSVLDNNHEYESLVSKTIQVDPSISSLEKFGVRFNDICQNNMSIIGARGNFLFACNNKIENSLILVDRNDITIIGRKNESILDITFSNNEKKVINITNEQSKSLFDNSSLVVHGRYGTGIAIGKEGEKVICRFLCHGGKYHSCKQENLEYWNKEKQKLGLISKIEGFEALDLVFLKSENDYGIIAGIAPKTKENTTKIAVYLEKNRNLVQLSYFDINDPQIQKIGSVRNCFQSFDSSPQNLKSSESSQTFQESILPGDEVVDGIIVKRHFYAACWRKIGKYDVNVCVWNSWSLPIEIGKEYFMNNDESSLQKVKFLGITSSGNCCFQNEQNVAQCLDLTSLNLSSIC